jgi:hypothetical protein
MATKNNWLKTNISERQTFKGSDFNVWHDVKDLRKLSWIDSVKETVDDLSKLDKKLYIPFSGGMDSEYVLKTMQHLNPTPIIVDTPGNKIESSYAFHYCRHNNITPVVIEKDEKEIINIYYEDIFSKLNGVGVYSVAALVASRYANDNGGVAIIGEHAYDGVSEWDFYNDVLIGEESSIYFFMWTPELVKAMMNEYDGDDHQEFKHRLYQIPFRPKIMFAHSQNFNDVFAAIMKKRKAKPNPISKVIL